MLQFLKFIFIVPVSFLFWGGIYDNLLRIFPNQCEMTYMFEYPQYKEVKTVNNQSRSNYKLYVYGEGNYFRSLSENNYRGIPVLFIPGNQGSFKQVRSLASVAYKKAQGGYPFHFNYFTIDFNEEIGALFGSVLEEQTHFVGLAIKAIMELYRDLPHRPHSVVLVGHSIGGLVARGVLRLQEVHSDWVSIIITLATPHARPVVIPDLYLESFYENVNNYWTKERPSNLKDIAFISIGGGMNDIQVPSMFTSSPFADLDETLLSVPECWLSTDHLAIVWCKQLVLALTRALFDSVDQLTLQIVSNKSTIITAFSRHISEKTEIIQSYATIEKFVGTKMKQKDSWVEINRLQHTQVFSRSWRKILAIPLSLDPLRQHLSIVFKGFAVTSWLIACKARVSNEMLKISGEESLDGELRIIPGGMKEANLNVSSLRDRGFTHVLTSVESSHAQTVVEIDFSDGASRQFSLAVPSFMEAPLPLLIIPTTPPSSLSMNITFGNFSKIWHSFILILKPISSCSSNEPPPVVNVRTSWTNRWEFVPIINQDSLEFSLLVHVLTLVDDGLMDVPQNLYFAFKLQLNTPAPGDGGFVEVHIVKSSSCVYSVSLIENLRGIFERVALLYSPQLPAFLMCHLLLILSNMYENVFLGSKSIFSHWRDLSPLSVIPFITLFTSSFSSLFSLETDFSYMKRNGFDIDVSPLILFCSTLPLTLLLLSLFKLIVAASSHVILLFVARTAVTTHEIESPRDSSRVFTFSSSGAVLLVSLAASTCGALSLLIAFTIYVIKVVKLRIDLMLHRRDAATPIGGGDVKDSLKERLISLESSLAGHSVLCLLLFLSTLFNLPTLMMWAKKLRSPEGLVADPSFFVSVVILCSLAILWQLETWNPKKKYYKHVSCSIHLVAILVILFGTIHLFRVSEGMAYTLLILALHQLLPTESEEVVSSSI